MTLTTAPSPLEILRESRSVPARNLVAKIDLSDVDSVCRDSIRRLLEMGLAIEGKLPEEAKYFGDSPQGRVVWRNKGRFPHIVLPLPPEESQ